jgi:predicted SnoaL-like aldol condensation-catalyzing enzyme
MSEVATARPIFDRLQDCAEREDIASLLGELGLGANGNATATALAADAEANQILVQRYFEMWNTGDRTEADAVLGPTYLDHAHPSVVGPAAVRSLVRRFRSENPDVWMAAEVVAFDSDYVLVRRAIRWSARGTLEPCGVALFRVAGGQLAEQWSWSPRARRVSSPPEPFFALRNYF